MKLHLLILSIFLLLVAGTASAQFTKGHKYIGGSLDLNYDGNGTTSYYPFTSGFTQYTISKTTTLEVNPEFGFFFANKWSIGIQPSFSHSSGTESSFFTSYNGPADNNYVVDTYNLNFIGVGINLRYYCMLNDKFGFFPRFGVSTSNNIKELSYGIVTIGGNVNVVYFPTSKLGLIMGFGSLGYNLNYKTKISTFNFGLNNTVSFGINYYYGK